MPNFRPFLPCVLLRIPQNPKYTKFFGHQMVGLGQYWSKSNNFWRWSGYISMPYFGPFLPCISLECPETPIALYFWATRGPKLGQFQSKPNHFWRWSKYISMPHFRPLLLCVLLRMSGDPNFTKYFENQKAVIEGDQDLSGCPNFG